MEWKNSYSVGIQEIDAQHRELLGLFSRVTELLEQADSPWSDTHYRIVELRRFAEFHFEFEEALMRLFGYRGATDHADLHKEFFQRLDAIQASSIRAEVKQEVLKLLFDWLTEHIMKSDKAYAAFILSGAPIIGSGPFSEV